MSHPRRARTNLRMYERMVMCKHRLHRIHCSIPRVKRLFLERWKANDWKENDERDDKEFLEVEKEIYLKMFPERAKLMEGEEPKKDDSDGDGSGDEDEVEVVED